MSPPRLSIPRLLALGTLSAMNPFAYLRTVLWSFFGIRRSAGAREDMSALRPVPLVISGLVLAGLFVLGLLTLAHWAASGAL